jgi:hypothetical protein
MIDKKVAGIFSSLVVFALMFFALFDAHPAFGDPQTAKTLKPSPEPSTRRIDNCVLITRPEGLSKYSWIGALMEEHLYFRFGISPELRVVDLDTIVKLLPQYTTSPQPLFKESYDKIIKTFGVTYIISQNFDISSDEKSVSQLLEILAVKENKTIAELEKTYPIESIGTQLDSVVMWFYQSHGKSTY